MAACSYFDDSRTLELKEVIRPFLKESGVGIAIYPSQKWEDTYEYSLIGFESLWQKARYKIGRQTKDLQLEKIHTLNDVVLALTNLKRHTGFSAFEMSVVFDENTDEISVEFFKDEPLTKTSDRRIDFRFDERTKEVVKLMQHVSGANMCGIMIFPKSKDEDVYLCNIFDLVDTDKGRKYRIRDGLKDIPLRTIQSFDDVVLALSNAKAYEGCTNFEIRYGAGKVLGRPAMLFYRD